MPNYAEIYHNSSMLLMEMTLTDLSTKKLSVFGYE